MVQAVRRTDIMILLKKWRTKLKGTNHEIDREGERDIEINGRTNGFQETSRMVRCCKCNASGTCMNCTCAKSGSTCTDCAPGGKDRCRNPIDCVPRVTCPLPTVTKARVPQRPQACKQRDRVDVDDRDAAIRSTRLVDLRWQESIFSQTFSHCLRTT